mmetsp:Transcript_8253/g.30505  ORF Transcript_8253/g.30505 Transcript_8253/m.30505 type:complete len:1908 (-) Transcript_8253:88-5811(-)
MRRSGRRTRRNSRETRHATTTMLRRMKMSTTLQTAETNTQSVRLHHPSTMPTNTLSWWTTLNHPQQHLQKNTKTLYYIQYYTSQNISLPKNEKGSIHPIKSLEITKNVMRKSNETGMLIKTDAKRVYHLSAPEGALVREWVRLGTELLMSSSIDTTDAKNGKSKSTTPTKGTTTTEHSPPHRNDKSDHDELDDPTTRDHTLTDDSDEDNTVSAATAITTKSPRSRTRPLNIRIPFSKHKKLQQPQTSASVTSNSETEENPPTEAESDPTNDASTPIDISDNSENSDSDTHSHNLTSQKTSKGQLPVSFDDDDDTDESSSIVSETDANTPDVPNTTPDEDSPQEDDAPSNNDYLPSSTSYDSEKDESETRSERTNSDDDSPDNHHAKRRGSHIVIARRAKAIAAPPALPPQQENAPTPPPLLPHVVNSLPQLLEEVEQSRAEKEAAEAAEAAKKASQRSTNPPSSTPQNLKPDEAPVDFMDASKPIDLHQTLFSERDIAALLTQDRAARRMNHRLSRRKFISSVIYVDTLHLQKEKSVLNTMQTFGDSDIHFSGVAKKSASGNKYLERTILVTSHSILFFYRRETNMLGVEPQLAPFGKVLNSFDITKKKVSYDFKERVEMQSIETLLLSQSPEQKNLVSVLLSEGEHDIDFVLDFAKQPSEARDNFIRQIMNAYRMQLNKKLDCITVYNIMEYTRLTKGQSKPTPVSVEDDEIIRSTDDDFFKVTDKLQFRSTFKQYGDNIVFFSQVAEKMLLKNTGVMTISLKQELERLIVVTNRALYNCTTSGDTPIKRRVELEDISEIVADSHDDNSVLIVIPSEYDMILKMPNRKTFVEVMEKVLITANFRSMDNVSRLAQLSKTSYIQKQKRNNDPDRIRKNLKKGIQFLDKHQLKKFLERAKQNKMLDDKVVQEAQSVCKEIDQADMLRKEWNKAWRENDLSYMSVILKRARNISIMHAFAKENALKLNQIINTKLLTQKMRDAILSAPTNSSGDASSDSTSTIADDSSPLDMQHIQYLFDLSLRSGLTDLVEEFRVRLETQIQSISTVRYAREYLQKRDRDGLLLTLENAQRLQIAQKYDVFDEAQRVIHTLADEDRAQKRLEVHIEQSLEFDDADYLQKELDKYLAAAQSTNNATTHTRTVVEQRARNTIDYIRERRQKKEEFSALINTDSTSQKILLKWIEETSSDDYFDTLCLLAQKKIHSHAFEMERRKQIVLIKEKFKTVLNAYKNTQRLNEEQLRQMIESCRHFPELELQIKAAETLLSNLEAKRHQAKEQLVQQQEEEETIQRLLQEDTLIKICDQEADKVTKANGGTMRNVLFQDKYSRLNDIITLKQEIAEAVSSQNRKVLCQLIEEAERIDQIQGVVAKAKDALLFMERQEEYSTILNQMLLNCTPTKQVEEFISSNRKNFSEEILLKARAVWETTCDREQRVRQCLSDLEETIDRGSNATIREAIERSLPFVEYSKELKVRVELANKMLEEGVIREEGKQKKEAPATQQRKRNISDNPHINELHHMVIQLLQQFGPDDINRRGKFPVTPSTPLAKALFQKIFGILSYRMRKYVFRDRTFWDVCKNLQMQGTQYAVRSFEAHIPPEKDLNLQSFYFIQFMLEQDYFNHCMQELFASAPQYISKSYYNDAIIAQDQYREELNTIFLLLHQFDFCITSQSTEKIQTERDRERELKGSQSEDGETKEAPNDFSATLSSSGAPYNVTQPGDLFADPLSLLKVAIQQLVAFFFQLYKAQENTPTRGVASPSLIADDRKHPELRPLVIHLTNCLVEVMQSSRKKSIYQTHVWNVIKKIAKNKQTVSVSDIGGVSLPETVLNVEEIASRQLQYDSNALSNNSKFVTFVCHSLNTRQLGQLFQSILHDEMLVKYYTGSHAYVLNSTTREVIIALLHKLDQLEFHLSLL